MSNFSSHGTALWYLPASEGRLRRDDVTEELAAYKMAQLSNPGGFQLLQTPKIMNSKKLILLSCVVPCVFAVSTATAQMKGHRPDAVAPRFSRFDRDDRFGRFDRDDRFRRFNRFNDIIFINDFGFPWWWGWGWGPWWGWNWGYPYGYNGGYNYGDYGSGYGYGDSSRSRVTELQRRLARAGYYHGAIDGILGPATRRAIRAYERDHNQGAYGMTNHY